nr:hypothetical protein [Tanacetum cinerariifolium]
MDLFETYRPTYALKIDREDRDKDEDPFAGSDRGSKRRGTEKDNETSADPKSKASMSSSSRRTSSLKHKSSSKSAHVKDPSHKLGEQQDREFNTGNKDDETGLEAVDITYDMLKGTCKSYVELEYHFEEVYKAMNDQLDWHNPKGQAYPFDLSKPLLLIQDEKGRQVMHTKAALYENIEGIEDMVPTLWTLVKVGYEKRITVVTQVEVDNRYDYGYLKKVEVRRDDQKSYTFKEGDFPNVNLCDIEDLLLFLVQKKLSNLDQDVMFDLNVALRMFTRRIVFIKRVEDL